MVGVAGSTSHALGIVMSESIASGTVSERPMVATDGEVSSTAAAASGRPSRVPSRRTVTRCSKHASCYPWLEEQATQQPNRTARRVAACARVVRNLTLLRAAIPRFERHDGNAHIVHRLTEQSGGPADARDAVSRLHNACARYCALWENSFLHEFLSPNSM